MITSAALHELCDVRWGDTSKTKASYVESGYTAYSASGPDGFLPYFDHDGPGIVLSAIGAQCGKTWFATGRWSCIKNTIVIRPRSSTVDIRYVYYATCDPGGWPKRGAAQPFISQTDARALIIAVPPLPVQRRIAEVLTAHDELIQNCQRRIRILEEMARALYREWFVLFRRPGHETAPCPPIPLPPNGAPKGWPVRRFDEVADVHRGRSYRSNELSDGGGVPFINLKCIDRDGGFRRSGLKRFTGEYKDTHVARPRDIVIAVTDMTQERRIVARAGLVPSLDHEVGVFSMDLVRIEPLQPWPSLFIYAYLRYSSFADELKLHANGANVLHLSPDRIREHRFHVPPLPLAQRFAELVAPMFDAADVLENKIDNLRRTRDLLLPRLLSGKIRLEDVG